MRQLVRRLEYPILVALFLTGAAYLLKMAYMPLGFVTLFALMLSFNLSAFYEIIELWDELYFNGRRIWGLHDTPNDLQWDLLGLILSSCLAYAFLRWTERRALLT